MTEKELICTSCKKKTVNNKGSTSFMCPNCGKVEIIRCKHCRELGTKWVCSSCEFSGPN